MSWLAEISIKWILMAVGALVLALTALRVSRPGSRSGAASALVENVQIVLSVVVVVFLIIRPHLFQAFYIPSGSMEPTLHGPPAFPVGDRLLVNKLVYRVSKPRRGEIAVFRSPEAADSGEKEFIKRVIGLPGETVQVVPSRLLVDGRTVVNTSSGSSSTHGLGPPNGEPELEADGDTASMVVGFNGERLAVFAVPEPQLEYDNFQVRVNGVLKLQDKSGRIQASEDLGAYGAERGVQGTLFILAGEPRLIVVKGKRASYDLGHVLVNGRRLKEPYIAAPPLYGKGPLKLGPDEYFMMGDNRNHSADSHVWGPLKEDRLLGRAEILFWPLARIRLLHVWLLAFLAALWLVYLAAHSALARRSG